ncbi:AAA-type ATPase family protein [Striga asiatica]|uniref:AAA-type ATPase family protein n=1 Tax=Striga asiatica TaxID=4170 RepID=A0A5A7P6C0_STRAF|nr:AAA-type ATPase family protein [Striga asiatica]
MDDFFSDSDGEKAVEELLSQAMDSTVLEQVAAINCAGFTGAGLPSHLETRFNRLKSLPPPDAPKPPAPLSSKSFDLSRPAEPEKPGTDEEKKVPATRSTKFPEEKGYSPDAGGSPFSPLEENGIKMEKKGRRKSVSSSSSSSFSSQSVSPPAKGGCFMCSPKKAPSRKKKKNKENRGLDSGFDWGKNDDKLLSDLSNFSVKSQRKMMKKAMEEEERVCREAEKIVNWAKQASARMDVTGIEDELSDDENGRFH